MKRSTGFTLLEMLVAVALLAICGTVMLSGFSTVRQSLERSRTHDQFSIIARSLIAMEQLQPIAPGVKQGLWDGHVHWQLRTDAAQQTTGNVQLYRLDLALWHGNERYRYVTFDVAQTMTATP